MGGDISFNEPPAAEVGGGDIAGQLAYVNTLDTALSTQYDRTAPPDQTYAAGSGIGYFDVVYLNYAGSLSLNSVDLIDFVTNDMPDSHTAVYGPNLYYGAPVDLDTVPMVGRPGTTGVMYPSAGFFYGYLFGDGTGKDAAGADYTPAHPTFAPLIDANACTGRTTKCQLITPTDLQGMLAGESGPDAMRPAVCGWNPQWHLRPTFIITECRDFDFAFKSDNPADWPPQTESQSDTWVDGDLAGWWANKALVPARELHAAGANAAGGAEWNYFAYDLVMHFTVGAAFDPEMVALGLGGTPGTARLACIEPGFDVTRFLAHEVDIYAVPNDAAADAVFRPLAVLTADVLTTIDALVDSIDLGPADPVLDIVSQGTNAALEIPRDGRPLYPVDSHGKIDVKTASSKDCIIQGGPRDGERSIRGSNQGKVKTVGGERYRNWLEAFIWQDLGVVGLASFRDPIETASGTDDRENPGGGVQFYFAGGNYSVGQWSQGGTSVAMRDGYYDVGTGCRLSGTGATTCIGDKMHTDGYRDPTSLVYVFTAKGPFTVLDWDAPVNFVYAAFTDTNAHCVLGASKNVISDLGPTGVAGLTVEKPQVIEELLRKAGHTGTIPSDQAGLKALIRTHLCAPGAVDVTYFRDPGFRDHVTGNSLDNPFGWQFPTTGWVDPNKAVFDLYYVVSVDKAAGLAGDRLCLNNPIDAATLCPGADPLATKTSDDATSITHVWQHRNKIGSGAS